MAQAWLVRPVIIGDKRNYAEDFLNSGYIASGPNQLPKLNDCNLDKIKKLLTDGKLFSDSLSVGIASAVINCFVNLMEEADLALLINGDEVHILEIAGEYKYVNNVYMRPGFLCHRRMIRLMHSYSRKDLSAGLRAGLKSNRQISNISKHYTEIYRLAYGKEAPEAASPAADTVPVSYPLRPNYNVNFNVPADITRTEAERLAAYIQTLFFKE